MTNGFFIHTSPKEQQNPGDWRRYAPRTAAARIGKHDAKIMVYASLRLVNPEIFAMSSSDLKFGKTRKLC
jgi:hypothetical protein